MSKSITIKDNRNNGEFTIPITDKTIRATDLQKMGLRLYDPGYMNTAVARSKICEVDGANGVLRYRGYPIEQLAENSTFLEVVFLLLYGELPSPKQLEAFNNEVMRHTLLHTKMDNFIKCFDHDAHLMSMLIASISALSSFVPEANPAILGNDLFDDKRIRNEHIFRLLGKVPTMAAYCFRNRVGKHYNQPRNDLGYIENFLYLMDASGEPDYKPNPVLVKALEVLFILHAEHELNCSTSAMRHVGSSGVDPYNCIVGAASALYGPKHGGANEAVVQMLQSIGSVENIPQFIQDVKDRKQKLMGFGHRVYKNYDPRAKIVRKVAYDVFAVVGREPLIEIAVKLEEIALRDDFFKSRKLFPNVDFYSGLIYKAMGFPTDFFPVLFAIPRVGGWLSHWNEMLDDPERKINRPRQIYQGEGKRDYVSIDKRNQKLDMNVQRPIEREPFSKRSEFATFKGQSKL